MSEKKILGRPKETLDSLPDEWQKDILEIYKIGGSDVEVKAKLYEFRGSFSNDLWDRWMKEEPIFSETIKTGKILAEAWWVKNGRTNLKESGFSYTGWYMQMKNRYGWKDKQETTQNINAKVQNIDPIEWVDDAED